MVRFIPSVMENKANWHANLERFIPSLSPVMAEIVEYCAT